MNARKKKLINQNIATNQLRQMAQPTPGLIPVQAFFSHKRSKLFESKKRRKPNPPKMKEPSNAVAEQDSFKIVCPGSQTSTRHLVIKGFMICPTCGATG